MLRREVNYVQWVPWVRPCIRVFKLHSLWELWLRKAVSVADHHRQVMHP